MVGRKGWPIMKMNRYGLGVLFVISLFFVSCSTKGMDKGEKGSVRAAYFIWIDRVEKSHGETGGVTSLYSGNAILLPTLSPHIYDKKSELDEYFSRFLSLKNLKITTTELITREYGSVAMNTGFYTITHMRDGKIETVKARFDFWYKKIGGEWKIIFHQSSRLPEEQM